MALRDARYIDARQATFNEVGRDLNNNTTVIHSGQTIHNHIQICYFGPQSIRHYGALCTDVSRPIISSETRRRLVTYCSSDALFAIDAAAGIIDLITDLLMDCRDSPSDHRDFALEFESLQQTFTLTRLTIQMYDGKPLGQSLANTITPEVLRCFITLRELLDSVNGMRQGFHFTSIDYLWRQIWWARLDADEFVSLREKLSRGRQSLQGLLMSLHSYVLLGLHAPPSTETYERLEWMELGNELHAGFVTLRNFLDKFGQRLPFLGHIKLNAVDVVSHLGEIIPVPTMFCSTWKVLLFNLISVDLQIFNIGF